MRQPAGPGAAQPGAGSLRGRGSLGRPISGPPLAVVAPCHLPLPSSQPVRRVCPSGARRGGGGQLHIQSLPGRLGAPVQSFMLQQFPEPGRAAGLCAQEIRGPGMVLHLATSPPTFPRPWVWLQAGSRLAPGWGSWACLTRSPGQARSRHSTSTCRSCKHHVLLAPANR